MEDLDRIKELYYLLEDKELSLDKLNDKEI